MTIVNLHEAKTNLSRLVDRAVAGEEIVIARAGHPLVRLVPHQPERRLRPLGLFAGQPYRIDHAFDELPDEIQTAFEGRGE
jgi:prevent-host-death family protein